MVSENVHHVPRIDAAEKLTKLVESGRNGAATAARFGTHSGHRNGTR